METILQYLLFLGIGLFSGFMSGMFGIGGGSIRIPLLNLVGVPLISAFGINLFVIPFSSAVGAFTHRKNIKKKMAIGLIVGGILGSAGGALLAGNFSTLMLAIVFVIISSITILGVYLYKIAPGMAAKLKPSFCNSSIGAVVLNLITGMRGGSGGSLFPPFLKALGLDIHEAIATSLLVTIFTALSGLVVYWGRGDLYIVPALFTTAGAVIGSRTGSRLSLKTKSKWLELSLSILVLLFSLLVVYKAV